KKSLDNCKELVTQKSSFEIAHPRLELVQPSFDKLARVTASTFFDLNESASEYGSAVHEAFEQVEWWGDTTLKSLESSNRSESVIQCMIKCFSDPVILELFTMTDKQTVLWREKSFSLVQDEKLINGVFDRVHLQKNKSGSYEKAIIIDFKTDCINKDNTITQAVEKHRTQMLTYQSALSALTGIETSSIELYLIFTSIATRIVL
ncbi:MAG: PD-(D/E)XK nuclease family protein, partial [Verrucomicrobiota bacterium]|nr:PD-(D/E)XK nuclease family protein [Verrucomicrobiota bacterium]